MIFGAFVPQGWKMELVSIADPQEKWAKAVEIAVLAEELGYDSVWVYDHFHNVPVPAHEAMFECWTTLAAISQRTSRDPPRPDGRVRAVPQPGSAGQDHLEHRRDVGRPARLGHRRGLVRARVRRLRLRLPRGQGPHRGAAGDRRDREVVVARGRHALRREVLPAARRAVRPEAVATAASADLDRRWWRAAHVARRRSPRRPLQLRWQA